jgi:hypothetical protein
MQQRIPAVFIDKQAVDASLQPAAAREALSASESPLDAATQCALRFAAAQEYIHEAGRRCAMCMECLLEEAQLAPVGAPGVSDDPVGFSMLLSPASHLRQAASQWRMSL